MTHTPADCKSIFVSWTWLVGILMAALAGVGGLVYGYSQRESKQDYDIASVRMEVTSIKSGFSGIGSDLDSIKIMLRERRINPNVRTNR